MNGFSKNQRGVQMGLECPFREGSTSPLPPAVLGVGSYFPISAAPPRGFYAQEAAKRGKTLPSSVTAVLDPTMFCSGPNQIFFLF